MTAPETPRERWAAVCEVHGSQVPTGTEFDLCPKCGRRVRFSLSARDSMSLPETPRERALRLWEAVGYTEADGSADYDAYRDALAAALASFAAGRARYRHEHPGNKP